ncbi:M23 family metallopeptidase [Pseudonocardia sp. TRM90224]|uniref:M23 family metallopeptidase n=1 Tax=Pseudonocardia sp. TRM90224 TaxID=2812678 RepID=UPI001E3B6AC4|nr:M23 family metallopeptidase [Pseudonocardia sp. TRM90224]
MARHRSPSGRRAHLGPPLSAMMAAAGVGGGGVRSIPMHKLPSSPFPALKALAGSTTASSMPARFVAMAIAGGAVAAAGQHALAEALPAATDGANQLRLGVQQLLGGGSAAQGAAALTDEAAVPVAPVSSVTQPLDLSLGAGPAVAPVDLEPVVADAAELVKAADLQKAAAEVAAQAAAQAAKVQAEAAAAAASQAAEQAKAAARPGIAAGGAIQMLVGRVTSGFGLRAGAAHQGLDIAAPIGTPIKVPLAGTVIDSGPASGFGLWVRVQHSDGTITIYGHINKSLVRKGQKVQAGQVIAEVGNRGQSTGPHLHIEVVTPGGKKINPRTWLDQKGIGYLK